MVDANLPDVVREPGGMRITFPRRKVPQVVGCFLLVPGLFLGGFVVSCLGKVVVSRLHEVSGFDWMLVFIGLSCLPFVLVAIGLSLAGAVLLAGGPHCTVWLRETTVVARERAGFLRWTWRVPRAAITACLLADHTGGAVVLRRRTGRDVTIAPEYGAAALARLVELLAEHLPRTPWFRGANNGPAPGTLQVVDDGYRWEVMLPGRRRLAWDAGGLHLSGRGVREQHWTPDQIADLGVVQDSRSGSGRYRAFTITGAGAPTVELRRFDAGAERWLMRRFADARAGRAPEPPVPAADLVATLRKEPDSAPGVPDPGRADPDALLPPESPIRCVRDSHGLTIELPPRGLGRRNLTFAPGLMFAIVGLGGGIAALVLGTPKSEFFIAFGGFLLFFAAIGLTMAIAGLRSGTRRTLVAVRGDEFALVLRDRLATRTVSATSHELGPLRVEPTGTTVNNRAFFRIAIARRGESEIRFGSECTLPELEAVAARLRAALAR